jgi:hypothetical protein
MVIVAAVSPIARTRYARPRMDVQLVPAPPEPIRVALEAAVARELHGAAGPGSSWWRAGLSAVDDEADDYGETAARPRSSRGATRA